MTFAFRREFFPDLVVRRPAPFPSAVEMLEPPSCKPFFGQVAKDQVGFRYGCVLPQVPGLADREVAQEVLHRVRRERNGDKGVEQFPRFAEVRRAPCEIKKTKGGQGS